MLQLDPCKAIIPYLVRLLVWKGLRRVVGLFFHCFSEICIAHCYVFCCFYSQKHIRKTFSCFFHATYKIHDNSQFDSAVHEQFYNSEGDGGRMQTSDWKMPAPIPSSASMAFQILLSKKQLFVELQRIWGIKCLDSHHYIPVWFTHFPWPGFECPSVFTCQQWLFSRYILSGYYLF